MVKFSQFEQGCSVQIMFEQQILGQTVEIFVDRQVVMIRNLNKNSYVIRKARDDETDI